MKVRDGHVSNSSSSSFLLIATKEAFVEARKEVDKYTAYVATEIEKKFTKKLGDQELIVINEFSFDDGSCRDITEGIDEPKPTFTSKRGCEHKVEEKFNFCPKCGKPRIVEEEVDEDGSVVSAWLKFRGVLEKQQKGILTEHRDF